MTVLHLIQYWVQIGEYWVKNVGKICTFDINLPLMWFRPNSTPFSVKKVTKIAPKCAIRFMNIRVYRIPQLKYDWGSSFTSFYNPVENNINGRFIIGSTLVKNRWKTRLEGHKNTDKFDCIQHLERGVSSQSDCIQRQESDKNSTKEQMWPFAFSHVLDPTVEPQSRKPI